MVSLGDIDDLSLQELRSALAGSLSEIEELKRMVALMAAEIARLKDLNQQPNIKPNKPSGMDQGTPGEPNHGGKDLRGRLGRGPKKAPRVAVEDEVLSPEVPSGSRFKGYQDYIVQDLVIRPRVIRYRRARWVTADGKPLIAPLPAGVEGHFGPELRRYVLMQYHQGQVTVPRIVALLTAMGIDISKRQVLRLLLEGKDAFLAESQDVLRSGLTASPWVNVDDTGARHKGKNGYCTHRNKAELLKVLDYPQTPLHTNGAENDIRCQVAKRKISRGTRSDLGRDCRNAFLGIAKTCAKLDINFWDYLGDRLNTHQPPHIPDLADLVSQQYANA